MAAAFAATFLRVPWPGAVAAAFAATFLRVPWPGAVDAAFVVAKRRSPGGGHVPAAATFELVSGPYPRYPPVMHYGARIHRKSWDTPWDAHCLTFSCFRKQPFFDGTHSPRWFLDAVDRARAKHPFDLWGFVIMPEHVHMVILPAEGVMIRTILAQIKLPVTRRALRFVEKDCPSFIARMTDRQPNGKVTRRFWQRGGGYDRNLRSTRDVHEKIRYIHENPVRRGLVQSPEDWVWSSARAWAFGVDEPIRIDRESLSPLEIL